MFFFQKPRLFKKRKIKAQTVFAVSGFRFDRSSHSTQAEAVEYGIQQLRQYIQACRVDPYFGFLLPEAGVLLPYLDVYPEDNAFVIQLTGQARCGTGGVCVIPSQSLVSGESLLRNLVGAKFLHASRVQDQTPVMMAWDGHNFVPQLPQIMDHCGLKALVFERRSDGAKEGEISEIPALYYWMAPNGAGIYAFQGSFRVAEDWQAAVEKCLEGLPEELHALHAGFLPEAAPMQPPRTALLGTCHALSRGEPSVIVSGKSPEHYFSVLDTYFHTRKKNLLPSLTRDRTQGSEGADLSRMDLNIACRKIENALYAAEFFSVLTGVFGGTSDSPALHDAWYQLFDLQQHHAVGGWCSDIAYVDFLACARKTLEGVCDYRRSAAQRIADHLHAEALPGETVVLFNPIPWRRDGVCSLGLDVTEEFEIFQLMDMRGAEIPLEIKEIQKDKNGRTTQVELCWVELDAVSAGYQTCRLQKPKEPQSPYLQVTQTQTWIENDFIRLEIDVDNGGGISSLVDKTTGHEFINNTHEYPAHDVLCLSQNADSTSPRRLNTTGATRVKSMHPAQVEYFQSPISQSLMIKGHGPGPCRALQEIKLYHELPYIDAKTVLENYQGYGSPNETKTGLPQRDLYLLTFPLNLPGSLPVLEDRFYAKAYHRSLGNLDFRGDEHTILSHHGMNAFDRWVDVSWCFLVRIIKNKTETGGIAVGPAEIVTPQEQHEELRLKLMMHLARHGVTCTPRRDLENPGEDRLYRQYTFSIGTVEENQFTRETLHAHSAAKEYYDRSIKEFGYAVLIVPVQWRGKEIPVFLFAGKTDALTEQAVNELIHSTIAHRWDCPASACFLSDLPVVQDVGFAFLSAAPTVCSLEQDGTLAVGLMHTAPYISPKTTWGLEFAEQKSHVFEYRLLPHDGDWRHADIPRRAAEYHHPLYCVSAKKPAGNLPKTQSLFSVEPSNLMISSIKPPGGFKNHTSALFGDKNAAVLRIYEAHGEESNVWIESGISTKPIDQLTADENVLKGEKEIFWENGSIRTMIHANEITAFRLHLKPASVALNAPKPAADSVTKRIYTRYWKYGAGSIANAATDVRLILRGEIPKEFGGPALKMYPFHVLVSNTSFKTIEGVVDLEVPSYWRVLPEKKKYQIEAGGWTSIPVLLVADRPVGDGVIRAMTPVKGVQVVDEMTVGTLPAFDLEMTLTSEAFFIHLQHHLPYKVRGAVELISPIETWSKEAVGALGLSTLHPVRQEFDLEPEQKQSLEFFITDYVNLFQTPTDHHWLIVKLTAQYCNWYYHVRLDGRPSGGLGTVVCT